MRAGCREPANTNHRKTDMYPSLHAAPAGKTTHIMMMNRPVGTSLAPFGFFPFITMSFTVVATMPRGDYAVSARLVAKAIQRRRYFAKNIKVADAGVLCRDRRQARRK